MKKICLMIGLLGGLLVCSAAGQSDLELIPFDVILLRATVGIFLSLIGFIGVRYFSSVKKRKRFLEKHMMLKYKGCLDKKAA